MEDESLPQLSPGTIFSSSIIEEEPSSGLIVSKTIKSILADPDRLTNFISNLEKLKNSSHDFLEIPSEITVQKTSLEIQYHYIDNQNLSEKILSRKMKITEKMMILYGTAFGLYSLHSQGIVHGDLNPNNIFVQENGQPIIEDFGIAPCLPPEFLSTHSSHNTIQYVAPEILAFYPQDLIDDKDTESQSFQSFYPKETLFESFCPDQPFSEKSDVYSYGVLIYELFTGIRFLPRYQDAKSLQEQVLFRQNRPRFYSDVPHWLRDLVEDCWSPNPDYRPNFRTIINRLRAPGHIPPGCLIQYQEFMNKYNISSKLQIPPINEDTGLLEILRIGKIAEKLDTSYALKIYQKAIEAGSAEAFYRSGKILLKSDNITKGKEYLNTAAEMGFGKAYYELAIYTEERYSFDYALPLYKKAAQAHILKAVFRIAQTESNIMMIREAAKSGNMKAEFHYGQFLLENTTEKHKAEKYLRKSADQGYWHAQYEYGKILQENPSEEKKALACAYLKAASDGRHSKAMFQWGKTLCEGIGTDENMSIGFPLIISAAESGVYEAALWLTNFLKDGLYKDNFDQRDKALFALKQATSKQKVPATYFYGLILENGWGVDKNQEKAFRLLKSAADQGYGPAKYELAQCYHHGIGVEISQYQYVLNLSIAAKLDIGVAAFEMYKLYQNGYEPYLKKSPEKEMKYLKLASSYRYPPALVDYSMKTGDADEKTLNVIKKAADEGDVDSQIVYARGILPINPDESLKYYCMATQSLSKLDDKEFKDKKIKINMECGDCFLNSGKPKEASLYYQAAAKLNSIDAAIQYAIIILSDEYYNELLAEDSDNIEKITMTFKKEKNRSIRFLELTIDQGVMTGLIPLVRVLIDEYSNSETSQKYIEIAATKEDYAEAQLCHGQYLYNTGIEEKQEKGKEFLEQACSELNEAKYVLGKIKIKEGKKTEGWKLLDEATNPIIIDSYVDPPNIAAIILMAERYFKLSKIEKALQYVSIAEPIDREAAANFYEKHEYTEKAELLYIAAAKEGTKNSETYAKAGIAYYSGHSVARDLNAAINYLQISTNMNQNQDPLYLYYLGIAILERGNKNERKAGISNIMISANTGYIPALITLAKLYISRKEILDQEEIEKKFYMKSILKSDPEKGLSFLKLAADQNNPEGQFEYGRALELIHPDKHEEAIKFIRTAAHNECAHARDFLVNYKDCGSNILISSQTLNYNPIVKFNGLMITLISASDLPYMREEGTNPYCVLFFGQQKRTSQIIQNNINPEWNEEFFIEALDNILSIDIYDKTDTQENLIGTIEINIDYLVPITELSYEINLANESDENKNKSMLKLHLEKRIEYNYEEMPVSMEEDENEENYQDDEVLNILKLDLGIKEKDLDVLFKEQCDINPNQDISNLFADSQNEELEKETSNHEDDQTLTSKEMIQFSFSSDDSEQSLMYL